jgi:hypothetical protein
MKPAPPLTYPLAEAEAEIRRLRALLAKFARRLDAVEAALRRHTTAAASSPEEPAPQGGTDESSKVLR